MVLLPVYKVFSNDVLICQLILVRQISETYWNKEIRDPTLIFHPSLAVSLPAAVDISSRAMDDHDCEKARIEPGKRRVEPGNEAPGNSEEHVTCIMHLARHANYPRQLRNLPPEIMTYTIRCIGLNRRSLSGWTEDSRCTSRVAGGTSCGQR